MSLHSTTRVPVDDSYVALVGKAVYVFAYYEWAIIYIIEFLKPGFGSHGTDFTRATKQELESFCIEFDRLIVRRNALIHKHFHRKRHRGNHASP